MKNPELMEIIEKYELSSQDIANRLEVSIWAVNSWRRSKESKYSAHISKPNLKLLKLSLEA